SVRLGPSADRARIRRASSTCRPRMRSTDRRIFRGAIRTYFAVAFASIFTPQALAFGKALRPGGSADPFARCARSDCYSSRTPWCSSFQGGASLGVMTVGPEGPGHRELAQLVPHHRLGDEDGDVLAPVVHGDGVSDHLGNDGGPPRPRPDHALVPPLVHVEDLLHQMVIHERTLLDRPCHVGLAPSLSAAARDEPIRRLRLPRP